MHVSIKEAQEVFEEYGHAAVVELQDRPGYRCDDCGRELRADQPIPPCGRLPDPNDALPVMNGLNGIRQRPIATKDFEQGRWYVTVGGREFRILDDYSPSLNEETASAFVEMRDGSQDYIIFDLATTKAVPGFWSRLWHALVD